MPYSFVYLLTNAHKNVLYCGVTTNIQKRMHRHASGFYGKTAFSHRYNCIYLVYGEAYSFVIHAIDREKQIKGYSRKKKEALIASANPDWRFLSNAEGAVIEELDEYCVLMG
jgi:putative endonuclease